MPSTPFVVPQCPILLLHGLIGFRRIFGREYYAGVAQHLESVGCEVQRPVTHPFGTYQLRSRQLLEFLDGSYPDRRVHIIAHSMGGIDARYLASPQGMNQGHRVWSITTIGTPHHGSHLAGYSLMKLMVRAIQWLGARGANLKKFDDETRAFFAASAQPVEWGVRQLTTEQMERDFNTRINDHPQVVYRSYSGKMGGWGGAPIDLFFLLQWVLLYLVEGANDGLVSVASGRWGDWRGIIPASHRDQVGHLRPRDGIPFNRLQFYTRMIQELAELER